MLAPRAMLASFSLSMHRGNAMTVQKGLSVIALLTVCVVPISAQAASSKDTVAKERAPGTTSRVGNRCYGGTFNSCYDFNVKQGTSARGAADHCRRTCAK